MYNNIGLQTPRGSGTSGYVSANKAKPRKVTSKLEFLKELKHLRENILPPPRKANKDILEHKQKREIYVKLAEMRIELRKNPDLSSEQVEEQLKQTEALLLEKYHSGAFDADKSPTQKDSHALALVKEKEQQKLREAFKVQADYELGTAFDFEAQEKRRLEKLYSKKFKELEKTKLRKKEEKDKKRRDRDADKKHRDRSRSAEKRRPKSSRSSSRSASSASRK